MSASIEPTEPEGRSRHVVLGVVLGALAAFLLSLVVVFVYLVAGSQFPDENETTLPQVLLAYWVSGVVGGAVVGALLPWTRRRLGATLVGMVGALPFSFAIVVALEGTPGGWEPTMWGIVVGYAMVVGGWLGYYFWSPPGVEGDSAPEQAG